MFQGNDLDDDIAIAVRLMLETLRDGQTNEQWLRVMQRIQGHVDDLVLQARDAVGLDQARVVVSRGAAYLDATYPGWQDRLRNTPTWHVSSVWNCPLSVASGKPYFETAEIQNGTAYGNQEWAMQHGFMSSRNVSDELLTDAWQEILDQS
jgi:hypothetical protein